MTLRGDDCEWQELMNGPYKRWQEHDDQVHQDRTRWTFVGPAQTFESSHLANAGSDGRSLRSMLTLWSVKDMLLHACHTEAERAACVFGKLNQQIENGGVYQWVDNGYAFGCIDWLPDYLPATGPVGQKIWDSLRLFLESYMGDDGEIRRFREDDEDGDEDDDGDWQDCMSMSDRLSSEFYKLEDEWHLEVYAYLAKLSEPVVNEEIVHRETVLDGRFG